MARRSTEDILGHADELAAMFESSFEPTSTTVTDPLDGLRKAVVTEANARKNVEVWVANARGAKVAWRAIGGALGTTGEAARQRFGPALGELVSAPGQANNALTARKAPAKRLASKAAAKFPVKAAGHAQVAASKSVGRRARRG